MVEQNNDQVKITSAADYRKLHTVQTKIVTLPSGAMFKVRKLMLLDFIATVILPSGLIKDEDLKDWENKTEEERKQLASKNMTTDTNKKMIRNLLVASLLEPKVVDSDNPKEDELSVDDILKNNLDSIMLVSELMSFNGLDNEYVAGVRPFREDERINP